MLRMTNKERRRVALHLRHTLHWPLGRIARRLEISESGVSHLLRRTSVAHPSRIPLLRRRVVRPFSLSRSYNV
jgi:hypothetical protein